MRSKVEFRRSAIIGLIVAACLSTVVLLLATQNIILALASILSVGIVGVTIVALIATLQWELGLSESLCIVIMIGLSIDYCVYIAMDYAQQPFDSRTEKM